MDATVPTVPGNNGKIIHSRSPLLLRKDAGFGSGSSVNYRTLLARKPAVGIMGRAPMRRASFMQQAGDSSGAFTRLTVAVEPGPKHVFSDSSVANAVFAREGAEGVDRPGPFLPFERRDLHPVAV
jgi:hypothetical protein